MKKLNINYEVPVFVEKTKNPWVSITVFLDKVILSGNYSLEEFKEIFEDNKHLIDERIEMFRVADALARIMKLKNNNALEIAKKAIEQHKNFSKKAKTLKVKYRYFKTKAGTYHPKSNVIYINKLLDYADEDIIRFVALHELVHTKNLFHDADFNKTLERLLGCDPKKYEVKTVAFFRMLKYKGILKTNRF